MLLSDLGIAAERRPGLGAGIEEWRRFARRLRGAQCPVVAFVPYGEQRWPAALRRAIAMVPWDRATNVSRVRQLLGYGLTVAGAP